MMIPTPNLSHLTKEDYEFVYEPAEDTYILLDALEEDAKELREIRPLVSLEIGSGSGCVTSFIGSFLGSTNTLYLTTDINVYAARCTARTGYQNKIPVEPIIANLVGPLKSRLRHSIDLLVFNPPYVPTFDSEVEDAQDDKGIAGAWAGGIDGMQVTDVLLEQIDDLLSPRGRFYLVAVKQNDVPGIQKRMLDRFKFQSDVVLQRRAGREHLFVIRFKR